jgi:hypothetical protein
MCAYWHLANACHNGLGEMAAFVRVFAHKGVNLPKSDCWHLLAFL